MRDWSEQTDLCGKPQATQLARELRKYWRKRGYIVNTKLEPCSYDSDNARLVWCVRSNMVNGLPSERLGMLS